MIRSLKWLTILSLDAPVVAVAWQAAFEQAFQAPLDWQRRILLFVSVWLGYVADRMLDAGRGGVALTSRHRWYAERRSAVLAIWLATLLAAALLALSSLSAAELARGCALAAAAVAYALFAQAGRRIPAFGFLKCACVAMLIALAAGLFALDWATLSAPEAAGLALSATLFLVNCLLIRHWDGDGSLPRPIAAAFAAVALAGGLAAIGHSQLRSIGSATLLSLALLFGIDWFRVKLGAETTRALADVALLSPLLLLPLYS